jgi:hypothetical protein
MTQPAPTVETTLRFVRTVHGLLLFAMFMYVLTAERILPHQPRTLNSTIGTMFLVLSILMVSATVLIQQKLVGAARDTLHSIPDDPNSLAKWRRGVILTDVLLESVVLYGFALRFLGGTLQQALPFYAAGIGLMIPWWPRNP